MASPLPPSCLSQLWCSKLRASQKIVYCIKMALRHTYGIYIVSVSWLLWWETSRSARGLLKFQESVPVSNHYINLPCFGDPGMLTLLYTTLALYQSSRAFQILHLGHTDLRSALHITVWRGSACSAASNSILGQGTVGVSGDSKLSSKIIIVCIESPQHLITPILPTSLPQTYGLLVEVKESKRKFFMQHRALSRKYFTTACQLNYLKALKDIANLAQLQNHNHFKTKRCQKPHKKNW